MPGSWESRSFSCAPQKTRASPVLSGLRPHEIVDSKNLGMSNIKLRYMQRRPSRSISMPRRPSALGRIDRAGSVVGMTAMARPRQSRARLASQTSLALYKHSGSWRPGASPPAVAERGRESGLARTGVEEAKGMPSASFVRTLEANPFVATALRDRWTKPTAFRLTR
jgi:hypothetical protein